MVTLGFRGMSRGLCHGSMGFECFMKEFDFPSFFVNCRNLIAATRQIAADQIKNSRTVILVFKDLLEQQNRERNPWDPSLDGSLFWKINGIDSLGSAVCFLFFTQKYKSIRFGCKDEILLTIQLDIVHVFIGAKPTVRENIPKNQLVHAANLKKIPEIFVLRAFASSFFLARFGIGIMDILEDKFIGDRNAGSACIVKTVQQVDPFNVTLFYMIVMP